MNFPPTVPEIPSPGQNGKSLPTWLIQVVEADAITNVPTSSRQADLDQTITISFIAVDEQSHHGDNTGSITFTIEPLE